MRFYLLQNDLFESGKVSSGGDDDREKRRLENEREKLGLLHPHRTDTTLVKKNNKTKTIQRINYETKIPKSL